MLTLIVTVGLPSAHGQDKSVTEVEEAVNNLVKAMLHPSEPALKNLSIEQLTYGHSSGKVESQQEFIGTLVSGTSVFEQIEIENQTVQVIENTAIVRHTLLAKTNDPGNGPASIKLGIALTWIKTQG
ncbi:MAG: nuclear transport factor 2 family protein, partial [Sphingobacterium sp.]